MKADPAENRLMDATEAYARSLDHQDPLAGFRQRFYVPQDTLYLVGNSLGLLSRDGEAALQQTLADWRSLMVRGWLQGQPPWFYLAEQLGEAAAPLVGAAPDEVVLTGTATTNIHALLASFYCPRERRTKILSEALAFSSDVYALQGQIKLRGGDPQRDLVLVPSGDGRTIDEQALIDAMTDEVAIAWVPSVLYRSGQLLDIERLAAAARERGVLLGVDACHSAGVVPHRFDDWGVDFGVWCGYKYLNGGPGCSGFLYVNRRHFEREPLLAGWFGMNKAKQFDLGLDFDHQRAAGGWQISAPGIIGSAALCGSLAIAAEAGIEAIRTKSLQLTSYLIALIDEKLAELGFVVGSPREAARRGGHVALEHAEAYRISEALRERSVVADQRPPNVIRVAPVALYNTFHDVWRVVQQLKDIVASRSYEQLAAKRAAIT